MKYLRLLVITALVAAGGCAERSGCPQQLEQMGVEEGRRGLPASLPSPQCELSEAERDGYFAARHRGLLEYCDGAAGFRMGLAGETPEIEVCPAETQKAFRSGWRAAVEIVRLEKRRSELLAEADRLLRTADGLAEEARQALIDQASARQQDARQDENDLEALRGLATVQGWQAPPEPPMGANQPSAGDDPQ